MHEHQAHGHDQQNKFMVGLDVGSTTVKAVVVNAATDEILWQDYQRHETKQPEKTLEFLKRMEKDAGISRHNTRMFLTGSGGGGIAEQIGAKFVQEVTAVSLAVEKLHPEVYSVVELGGQDAKIIVFKDDDESGRKKKIPSMNDKCAGGTGAVIDKINAKLKIPVEELAEQGYHGIKLHKVAGKCGVFAETDINSLQKVGTPPDELMASLFEAIILQNLSVLTRGHTLRPHVLLLGGPNTFIRGMREAWQANIPRMWQERKVEVPAGAKPEDLIKAPQNAQYFAALGSIEFGKGEDDCIGCYQGYEKLIHYIEFGRQEEKAKSGGKGLVAAPSELEEFKDKYRRKKFVPATFQKNSTVAGFVGIDGGSTSTKAVLLDENGDILCKTYQLSNGNPIQDTIDMFENLRKQIEAQNARMEVLGVGTTGYAKDILKDVLKADVALVETVAHTESALKFYEDPHVIVDVGGQDIKLIVLHNGRVKDFKLNTQCSAGNGYFLQSTAEGFGLSVEQYADLAFSAQAMPVFGYGCAVFMQSDIVNFQRQGWRAEEILAGLAAVLPKNVFLYVASIPNLAALGSRFVLQGGTQNNLAVVKAEVDFIRNSFRAAGRQPEIIVHEHCGESGLDHIRDQQPNFVYVASKEVVRPTNVKKVADQIPSRAWTKVAKERIALMQNRGKLRIGIPRVLNIYTYAPLFNGYFESLGVQPENIVYSDYTSSELYRAGASRGAIDPCFPAKIGISHVYNLIQEKHRKKPLNVIFFPMYDVLHSPLVKLTGSNACPTGTATPETVKAAFTKENDVFAEHNVKYINPVLNFADRKLFAYQMLQAWQGVLGLSQEENDRAIESGFNALKDYETSIRRRARAVIDQLEHEDRIGIVMLGRPYHHDPGLNHEILDEFQKLGYPIFSQNTLPLDEDLLDRLFGEEVRAGVISSPLDIGDAWKNSYSCSTNHKVWAAKFTARHPNLVALEISSFKCGHDAPIYGVMRRHYRAVRDAVFLLQGPRREQALGVDPYSRGND